jgi:protoporphyrinogen/coproporphyrinogen III oxidase
MNEVPVAIVGAGYAGLVAATRLRAAKIPFVVYEASPNIAGLATTFKDMPGYSYDFGTHLITNRLAATLGISDQCRDVQYFGESIFLRGAVYSYPFGLAAVPRYTLGVLRSRLGGKPADAVDAATWAEVTLGRAMAREVAIPLMESLTGAPAHELSPAIGNKLPSVMRTLMLRAAGKLSSKAVAIGYCQDLPEKASVWHVYPNEGIATICGHLAKDVAEHVKLKTPVQAVLVENGKVQAIKVADEVKPVRAVISTAPVNVLPRLVQGAEAQLQKLGAFRYSNMMFVNLFLRGRNLMPNVATWFPEPQFDFFRVQEPPISLPWTAPEGHTYLTVDIGCQAGDAMWNEADDSLAQRCLEQLKAVIPDVQSRFISAKVLRTKIAYPVYLRAYEEERKAFSRNSGVQGLTSVGRNGEFAHILMEDVYHRTVARVDSAVRALAA